MSAGETINIVVSDIRGRFFRDGLKRLHLARFFDGTWGTKTAILDRETLKTTTIITRFTDESMNHIVDMFLDMSDCKIKL